MLGVIHRAVLGAGPAHFQKFFRPREQIRRRQITRNDKRRHTLQLEDPREGTHSVLLIRSAFGLIGIYNLLPTETVAMGSVKFFCPRYKLRLNLGL